MSGVGYLAPIGLAAALEQLQVQAGICVVSGGTDVLPGLRAKTITPTALMNIQHLDELRGIEVTQGTVRLGALTTVAELLDSEVVRIHAGILRQVAAQFADPLVRNRATVGGNLATASPAGDTAVALLALDARLALVSAAGEREVPLTDFFVGPGKTVLGADELIRAISFASDAQYKKAHLKFKLRQAMAVAVASVAVVMEMDGRRVRSARVAAGAVAPKPLRLAHVEEFLAGQDLTAGVLATAETLVKESIQPISDLRASAAYRRHLTGVLFARAVGEALAG